MASLLIFNDRNEIILMDEAESTDALEDVLDAYMHENKMSADGGPGYVIKHDEKDNLVYLEDFLVHDGGLSARYELRA